MKPNLAKLYSTCFRVCSYLFVFFKLVCIYITFFIRLFNFSFLSAGNTEPHLGECVGVHEVVGEEHSWVGLHDAQQVQVVQLAQHRLQAGLTLPQHRLKLGNGRAWRWEGIT